MGPGGALVVRAISQVTDAEHSRKAEEVTLMSDAMTTDLHEVTVGMSYLREGVTGPATFSLFVRDLPFGQRRPRNMAVRARAILDGAGLPDVRIIAGGGLDEYVVDGLVRSGAPIDTYAVGSRVGVSADAPFPDSAYKCAGVPRPTDHEALVREGLGTWPQTSVPPPGLRRRDRSGRRATACRRQASAGDGDSWRAAHRRQAGARPVPGEVRRGPGRTSVDGPSDPRATGPWCDGVRAIERAHGPSPTAHRGSEAAPAAQPPDAGRAESGPQRSVPR